MRKERKIITIPVNLGMDILAVSDKMEVFGNFAAALRAHGAFEDNFAKYRSKLPIEINGVLYLRKNVWK